MNVDEFWENYKATAPNKLPELSKQKIAEYYTYFSEVRIELIGRDMKFVEATNLRVRQLEDERKRRRDRSALILSGLTVTLLAVSAVIQCRASRQPPTAVQESKNAMPSQTQTQPQTSPTPKP